MAISEVTTAYCIHIHKSTSLKHSSIERLKPNCNAPRCEKDFQSSTSFGITPIYNLAIPFSPPVSSSLQTPSINRNTCSVLDPVAVLLPNLVEDHLLLAARLRYIVVTPAHPLHIAPVHLAGSYRAISSAPVPKAWICQEKTPGNSAVTETMRKRAFAKAYETSAIFA